MIQFNVFFSANLADGFDRVLIGFTSSFFLRATFIKFIGLFPQYVTKQSAVPSPSRIYRISFSRGCRFRGVFGSRSLLSSHPEAYTRSDPSHSGSFRPHLPPQPVTEVLCINKLKRKSQAQFNNNCILQMASTDDFECISKHTSVALSVYCDLIDSCTP